MLIEFDSALDVEWIAQTLLRMEWWMGAQCHLECIPCSNEDALWDFRGMGIPWMDIEWIDPSRWGQVTLTGAVDQSHPENYGVPQFLKAIQNGQNITALGVLGTPHLAVFSGSDLPLAKGEATYNQWAFEVCSLWSHYQERVLWEGISQLLKGDANDMVRFLGPTSSLKAILDKLDSIQFGVYL